MINKDYQYSNIRILYSLSIRILFAVFDQNSNNVISVFVPYVCELYLCLHIRITRHNTNKSSKLITAIIAYFKKL